MKKKVMLPKKRQTTSTYRIINHCVWLVLLCATAASDGAKTNLAQSNTRVVSKSIRINNSAVYDLDTESALQTSESNDSGGFSIFYSEDISVESSANSQRHSHEKPHALDDANSYSDSLNKTFDLNSIFSQEQEFAEGSSGSGQADEDETSLERRRNGAGSYSGEAGIHANMAPSSGVAPSGGEYEIYSLPAKIILSSLATTASLITVCGNFLVMTAFFLDRQIRNPTNYFLLSLAISDFLIGLVSIPLLTLYLMIGKWPFGQVICNLWLSLDYTVCLTSIYTVLFITIDRFCSVKMPAKYRKWRTPNKIIIMVLLTWFIPISLFFPSIFGWSYGSGMPFDPRNCDVAWASNKAFSVTLVFSYFWSTLIVIVVLYVFIYQVARNLERKSREKQRKLSSLVGASATNTGALVSVVALAVNTKQMHKASAGKNNTHSENANDKGGVKTALLSSSSKVSTNRASDEPGTPEDNEDDYVANTTPKSRLRGHVGFGKSFLGGKIAAAAKKATGKYASHGNAAGNNVKFKINRDSSSQLMGMTTSMQENSSEARINNSSNSTTGGNFNSSKATTQQQQLGPKSGAAKGALNDSSSYDSHSDFDNSAAANANNKIPPLNLKNNTLAVGNNKFVSPTTWSVPVANSSATSPSAAALKPRPESLAIVSHDLSTTNVASVNASSNLANTLSSNVSFILISFYFFL
jgi:muscarinic acetylcholine receptor M3